MSRTLNINNYYLLSELKKNQNVNMAIFSIYLPKHEDIGLETKFSYKNPQKILCGALELIFWMLMTASNHLELQGFISIKICIIISIFFL